MEFGTVHGTRGLPSSHCESALGCTQKHQALISFILLRTETMISIRQRGIFIFIYVLDGREIHAIF